MTPSGETEALAAASGMSSLLVLSIACGRKPSQRSCEPLQGARRWPRGAHLLEERLRFPFCSPSSSDRAWQPDASGSRSPGSRPRAQARPGARRGWHPEPALPARPATPRRPDPPPKSPEPRSPACSRSPKHEAPPPRTLLRRAQMQGMRDRLRSAPPPQRGSTNTKHQWQDADCETVMGPGLGFCKTTSYPLPAGGAVPRPSDKILPSKPRLSPISPKGHRRQIQNLNKSIAYQIYVCAMPDLYPGCRRTSSRPASALDCIQKAFSQFHGVLRPPIGNTKRDERGSRSAEAGARPRLGTAGGPHAGTVPCRDGGIPRATETAPTASAGSA